MSEQQTEQDRTYWTGDRENYKQLQSHYNTMLASETVTDDGILVAAAIRAGLAELAVELSSVRGFGIGQAKKGG